LAFLQHCPHLLRAFFEHDISFRIFARRKVALTARPSFVIHIRMQHRHELRRNPSQKKSHPLPDGLSLIANMGPWSALDPQKAHKKNTNHFNKVKTPELSGYV
jgi:hypothetical protein